MGGAVNDKTLQRELGAGQFLLELCFYQKWQ